MVTQQSARPKTQSSFKFRQLFPERVEGDNRTLVYDSFNDRCYNVAPLLELASHHVIDAENEAPDLRDVSLAIIDAVNVFATSELATEGDPRFNRACTELLKVAAAIGKMQCSPRVAEGMRERLLNLSLYQ